MSVTRRIGLLLRRAAPATLAAALLAGIAPFAACDGGDAPDERGRAVVRVFAAASLTSVFEDLKTQFEARHRDLALEIAFDGTPKLVLQLQEGAVADVFASADAANVAKVIGARLNRGVPKTFATNKLAIVTPPGNPKKVHTVADLARDDVTVVMCGPEVPAGAYARAMLRKAEVDVESASDEPSVKAVVQKAQLGEIDAGIVYETDVKAAGETVGGVAIPDAVNVRAEYPIVEIRTGKQRSGGNRFIEFVLGPAGRKVLARHGFGLP